MAQPRVQVVLEVAVDPPRQLGDPPRGLGDGLVRGVALAVRDGLAGLLDEGDEIVGVLAGDQLGVLPPAAGREQGHQDGSGERERNRMAREGYWPYWRRSASESGSRAARMALCAPAMS